MNRLFWKIFLSFWITQAIILTIAVTLANLGVWRDSPDSLQQVQARMPTAATQLIADAERGDGDALKQHVADIAGESGARWWLFDPNGRELTGNVVPWWVPQAVAQNSATSHSDSAIYAANGTRGVYKLVAEPGLPRIPHIPYHAIGRQLLAGLLVSAFTCLLLAHYLTKPILRLRQATQAVASGDLSARAGESVGARKDEIGDLVRDFDRMATRIEALVQSQKQLLRDISHDLRSPLQRLRMAVGLARREASTTTQLDRIEREAVRINELVEQVLTLARLEDAAARPAMAPLSLRAIVNDVVDDASYEAERLECSVKVEAEADSHLDGNRELLHSAIENVVRNAIHHSAPHTQVKVTLAGNDGFVNLRVEDEGPGVPESALSRLFEPFFRVDESRGTTNGFGLGLAIAARAVAVHGGSIEAHNRRPHGLEVDIKLPTVGGNGRSDS